jgi:hypothetical protein
VGVILCLPGKVEQIVQRWDKGMAMHSGDPLRGSGQVEQGGQGRCVATATFPADRLLGIDFDQPGTSECRQRPITQRTETGLAAFVLNAEWNHVAPLCQTGNREEER